MSNPLWPHGLQHTRLPCPSLSPGVCSNSCLLRWRCHPTTSSSVTTFSCPQSFPASRSFPMGRLDWAATPFPRGSSQSRNGIWISCTAGRFLTVWDTGEVYIILLISDTAFCWCWSLISLGSHINVYLNVTAAVQRSWLFTGGETKAQGSWLAPKAEPSGIVETSFQ